MKSIAVDFRDLPGLASLSLRNGLSEGILYGALSSLLSTSIRNTFPRRVDLSNIRVRQRHELNLSASLYNCRGEMVKFKTFQIIYKARNKILPTEIYELFVEREGGYNIRGKVIEQI